jgi:hypothetical protein
MNDQNLQFHLVEYNALRQELVQYIKDSYSSVIYPILGSSAIVVWISSNLNQPSSAKHLMIVASLLPIFISVVSWLLYRFRVMTVMRIATYCKALEELLAHDKMGWETFVAKERAEKRGLKSKWTFDTICGLHIILSIYFALFAIGRVI